MHYLLTISCLLLAAYANGTLFFDDGTVYNPCKTNPDVYFYPHPTDTHKYYQCDGSGNAFERECAESLVWDPLGMACSWPTKSIYVPPKGI
jgi:DNA-binding beta-propeller fold protein YncE